VKERKLQQQKKKLGLPKRAKSLNNGCQVLGKSGKQKPEIGRKKRIREID